MILPSSQGSDTGHWQFRRNHTGGGNVRAAEH
jgi:hypothetical protein